MQDAFSSLVPLAIPRGTIYPHPMVVAGRSSIPEPAITLMQDQTTDRNRINYTKHSPAELGFSLILLTEQSQLKDTRQVKILHSDSNLFIKFEKLLQSRQLI